jgi:hypothetical protein
MENPSLLAAEAPSELLLILRRFSSLNPNKKKAPAKAETLFLVNLPRQFWNTFWADFELLHDSLIILGVSDHEL